MNVHDLRKKIFSECRRLVIKVGSNVLTNTNGLDLVRIHQITDQIAALHAQQIEIILVSSGAVSAGIKTLPSHENPTKILHKQALAAVGQTFLMQAWQEGFRKHYLHPAQVLLTSEDLQSRHRYLNSRCTLQTLIEWGIIPIINENDTVSVNEIQFGDNDQLAALVGGLVDADLVLILSDIDGLYTRDPNLSTDAKLITLVEEIDDTLLSLGGDSHSQQGTGGMKSKLIAAQKSIKSGIPMIIASGKQFQVIAELFECHEIGTLFYSQQKGFQGKKRWLAQSSKPMGTLIIDAKAALALKTQGASLLPIGILNVLGSFKKGDPVRCQTVEKETIGVGLSNYSSQDIKQILGHHSDCIEARIGYKYSDEVIHRDHFALSNVH